MFVLANAPTQKPQSLMPPIKPKIIIHSSAEVKKAGGAEAYIRKHGLVRVWSKDISGKIPLTKKETLAALASIKG